MAQTKIRQEQLAGGLDGWISAGETWTYASADDPTYTFTISGDKTSKYSAGMKIKLTQTTVKYFIITKVAYSSPNTTITVYGGTDYDLADAAISGNYYSMVRSPQGFPLSPSKWTVSLVDTSQRSQAAAVSGTWYNLGSLSISIPIGEWYVNYQVCGRCYISTGSTNFDIKATLSTANNSESSKQWTAIGYGLGVISTGVVGGIYPNNASGLISITSKASYYLNAATSAGGANTTIDFRGDLANTVIRAVCAYL